MRSPVTVAVRVQLYRMASSPNTFAGPMLHTFLPCFETSTIPSERRHERRQQAVRRHVRKMIAEFTVENTNVSADDNEL